MRTGQSWFDPVQVRVRRYNVTVTPGSALVGRRAASRSPRAPRRRRSPARRRPRSPPSTGDDGETEPGMEGMVKGPYVAETYPVTVEQEYVVVEIGR